jgi:hypothetical protein
MALSITILEHLKNPNRCWLENRQENFLRISLSFAELNLGAAFVDRNKEVSKEMGKEIEQGINLGAVDFGEVDRKIVCVQFIDWSQDCQFKVSRNEPSEEGLARSETLLNAV